MKAVTKKLLSLLLVAILLVSAVPFQAMATTDDGTTNQGTTNEGTTNEGTTNEGTTNEGTTNEGTTNEGTTNEGTTNEGTTNEGTTNEGTTNEGTTKEGTTNEGTTNEGTTNEGTTNEGTTNEGTTNEGTTNEPPVTEAPAPTTPAAGTAATMVLDGCGGTIGSALSTTVAVTWGNPIGTLPAKDQMSRAGYEFAGWYTAPEGGSYVESGTVYSGQGTLYAHWNLIQKGVTIKGVFGGQKSQAVDIRSENVAVSENLLDYLNRIESSIYPAAGYTWDGCWYDYSTDALIQQNESFSNWRTVYIKFEAKQYKLFFNAGEGATVSPTEKSVTFDQKVGTLPTPTRPGYVFTAWYDVNGNWYNPNTMYKVDGNTTLYANWKKQASVVLEIFINGKTAEPDRCPVLYGYGKGDIINRSDISSIIKKYYSSTYGSSLTIQGLYTSDMWQDYLADKSTAGIESIQLQTDEATTYIYVMVNNAKQGSSSTTTTTTGGTTSSGSTSNADPTNPQTGDSSMIYVPMTVMLVAAAALVAVEILRKKRMI